MEMLRQAQEMKRQKPKPPPMFMMIPIEEKNDENKRSHTKHKHTKSIKDVHAAIDSKLPEMRGGILFTRCYCVHRDGLQNSCPLSSCQEHPNCGEKPWPTCPPAKFLRCRYPQQFPTKNNN
ncbi:uncharacterized protein LOC143355473 [Halictus rubicundus]|uniref:uncharacterized protein LOC143355473 n=1 Tax=Halictus rubicundus TaxID=77578 RepID=UPI00403735E6